jgi:hypothetical protein
MRAVETVDVMRTVETGANAYRGIRSGDSVLLSMTNQFVSHWS